MFATIDAARVEVQKLSNEELLDLTGLVMIEYLAGEISERQATFVCGLIEEETTRRVVELFVAELEKSVATIN